MGEADQDGDGLISREDFFDILHTDDHDMLDQYEDRAKSHDFDSGLLVPRDPNDDKVYGIDGQPLAATGSD
eukprot:216357-Pyramimonas_sp.AAC.1